MKSIILTVALLLPGSTLALAGGECEASKASAKVSAKDQKDIVDTAIAAGSFKTLVKALEAAGLVDTLKGPGPFTVFAPTDEAFAKLPKGTLEALLKDKKALVNVLTYHVVSGKVTSDQVAKMQSAKTLQGSSVAISTTKGVRIGEAGLVKADILTQNGVIHVIDTVLIPKN